MQKEAERVGKALPLGLDAKMAASLLSIDGTERGHGDASLKGRQAVQ